MAERIVVDFPPVVAYEGGDQQEQGALRLVEVGDHFPDDAVLVARGYEDLRGAVQGFHPVAVEIAGNGLQRFRGRHVAAPVLPLVGHPLGDVQLFFRGIGILEKEAAYVVEALQRAHRSGAYGRGLCPVGDELAQGFSADAEPFGVHVVHPDGFALHRAERPCAHVQRDLAALHAFPVEFGQDLGRKVQSRRGSGHGALHPRVDGLVGFLVALLRFAVQVGWDGEFACGIEQIGPGKRRIVPGKAHGVARPEAFSPLGAQFHCPAFSHGERAPQRAGLPLFQIAHHAEPLDAPLLLKGERVVGRAVGLQAEHLDEGARLLAEVEAGQYDFRVVAHEERPGGQQPGQVVEVLFPDLPALVDEQFAPVAARQGVFGNPPFGQVVLEVFDSDLSCVHRMGLVGAFPLLVAFAVVQCHDGSLQAAQALPVVALADEDYAVGFGHEIAFEPFQHGQFSLGQGHQVFSGFAADNLAAGEGGVALRVFGRKFVEGGPGAYVGPDKVGGGEDVGVGDFLHDAVFEGYARQVGVIFVHVFLFFSRAEEVFLPRGQEDGGHFGQMVLDLFDKALGASEDEAGIPVKLAALDEYAGQFFLGLLGKGFDAAELPFFFLVGQLDIAVGRLGAGGVYAQRDELFFAEGEVEAAEDVGEEFVFAYDVVVAGGEEDYGLRVFGRNVAGRAHEDGGRVVQGGFAEDVAGGQVGQLLLDERAVGLVGGYQDALLGEDGTEAPVGLLQLGGACPKEVLELLGLGFAAEGPQAVAPPSAEYDTVGMTR